MKKVSENRIYEITYSYDDEIQRNLHTDQMKREGFYIVKNPFYRNNELVVTYQHTSIVDNIVRL